MYIGVGAIVLILIIVLIVILLRRWSRRCGNGGDGVRFNANTFGYASEPW